jgi:hypothetical protein
MITVRPYYTTTIGSVRPYYTITIGSVRPYYTITIGSVRPYYTITIGSVRPYYTITIGSVYHWNNTCHIAKKSLSQKQYNTTKSLEVSVHEKYMVLDTK